MKRKCFTTWAVIGLCAALAAGAAEEVTLRFANGKPFKGKVIQALEEGLEVEAPGGKKKTLPWVTLSAGTRYRYEPGFKARLEEALDARD